eukprot:TRINITY_DN1605_c3_g1_i1.p2 TRINITY_DN1605_c3_g1~~TRINITY_DN1605_c3_g1_i1.p2  ORF type:complete len:102 (+),score=5.66 TRINITY_DN1605_c3_g1_i1:283-588(+)
MYKGRTEPPIWTTEPTCCPNGDTPRSLTALKIWVQEVFLPFSKDMIDARGLEPDDFNGPFLKIVFSQLKKIPGEKNVGREKCRSDKLLEKPTSISDLFVLQ